jgi:hypothetical protein
MQSRCHYKILNIIVLHATYNNIQRFSLAVRSASALLRYRVSSSSFSYPYPTK